MAETDSGQEKTEEATPERRQEFRDKGQIAVSKEITSVLVLGFLVVLLGFVLPYLVKGISDLCHFYFFRVRDFRVGHQNIEQFAFFTWTSWLKLIFPAFMAAAAVTIFSTLMQTRLNWSWKKLAPDFNRLNPMKGLQNMVNSQAAVNTIKGIGKMLSVGLVSYLILRSEWDVVPNLLRLSIGRSWSYWGDITETLYWSICCLLILIAAIDYLYSFSQIEKQLKMSKQEVKEEYKRQEGDPFIKSRMKKLQRDIVFAKTVSATREATVLITNPTHFAIALKYEPGMSAPKVIAKGTDHLALHMRSIAKDAGVFIMEDKPLARLLYKVCEVGDEIPENLYLAVSHVIRYVFKMQGKALA